MEAHTQQQTEIYPAPPPWYTLYKPEADGSASQTLPPLPPEPANQDYTSFARIEPVLIFLPRRPFTPNDVETGIPPLAVAQLFRVLPNNTADYKAELQALNKEFLFQYLHFVDTLVDRPSLFGRDVEAISTILRNLHFLLNSLRSIQARASLEFMLKREIEDRQAALKDLRDKRERASALLETYGDQLKKDHNPG